MPDDNNYNACPYIKEATEDNGNASRYSDFAWISDFAKVPLASIFDIDVSVM